MLDTGIFGSGSFAFVSPRRVRRRMQSRMIMAMAMTPPIVPPIAGPVMELEDMIRASNLKTVKLTEVSTWRKNRQMSGLWDC